MSYNPYYEPPARVGIKYSRTELLHLAVAVVILTFAFSFFGQEGQSWVPKPMAVLLSFLGVSTGFILHELAHKVVAQRYGHWAEFRTSAMGLALPLILIATRSPILFAAPGAVLIRGAVTPRENGIISIAGPGTNLAIALVCAPFTMAYPWALFHDTGSFAYSVVRVVGMVNAVLGVFNLIPFWMFDGKKIFAWSKPAYFGALALGLALFVLILTGEPVA